MPVCLHCGEIGSEGALFYGKCGFTLPQPGSPPSPTPGMVVGPAPPAPGRPGGPPMAPTAPYRADVPVLAGGGYAVATPAPTGATGPMPPPPSAKYCVRCATLISSAAVYCPVCQQPQA